MNFGNCPYCDGPIGMFGLPDKTPAYAIVQCRSCGKDVWYKFSRINPESWTIEDFEKNFSIDYKNKKITPIGGNKDGCRRVDGRVGQGG